MSPDVLLSQLGLRYDGTGLQGIPARIVSNLIALTLAYDAGEYHTPNFVTAPTTSATFDSANVAKRRALNAAYHDALDSGNVKATIKAVDKYNKLLMVMGGQELVPPPDFEIMAHQQTPLGVAARWIVEWATGQDLDYETFFSRYGAAIRKYGKAK